MDVAWVHRHASRLGGAERYIHTTAAALAARGHRSTLYYDVDGELDASYLDVFDGAFPLVEPEKQLIGADVVYVHGLGPRWTLQQLVTGTPIVRFLHDHSLFCLRKHKYRMLSGETCRKVTGIRCYGCSLGGFVRSDLWPGVTRASLTELAQRQDVHRRDATVVVASRYLAEHARQHGFNDARVKYIPLFADAQPTPAVARDPHLVLYVGALLRSKGLDVLLKAFKQASAPLRLRIRGAGRQEGWVREMVDQLGLEARVEIDGPLNDEELAVELAQAGILVLPSRTPETFGLIGLEALAHGTPVVASAVGGIGEWLEPWRTGLAVPSNDPSALLRALERLSEDPELQRKLGAAGRRLAREVLTVERHVVDLIACFEDICLTSHEAA